MLLALAIASCLLHGNDNVPKPPDPPFHSLIDTLGDERIHVREEAAFRLRNAGREAWPALNRAAASHADPEIRARAAALLSVVRLRRRISYRVLEEHPDAASTLRNGATVEKIRLIRTMGRYFEESKLLLRELLRDDNPEIALAAAEALYENRNKEWVGRLLELYAWEGCPRAGRMHDLLAATSSLISAERLQELMDESGDRGRNRLLTLALHTNLPLKIAPDALRHMLRDGDTAARRAALAWMRDRGVSSLTGDVEALLRSADPLVVSDALVTLRRFRSPIAPARLAALLAHDAAAVRREAARSATTGGDDAALPALRRLLRDPSTTVREAALESLWARRGAAAREALVAVFLNDAGAPHDRAARLLIEDRRWALDRARRLTEAADPAQRKLGGELYMLMGELPALHRLSMDPEESVRSWTLREILRRERSTTLEMIEPFTRDPAEYIRFEAVRALVRRGKKEHLPALRSWLDSDEYTYRHDAAAVILERGGEEAADLAGRLAAAEGSGLKRMAFRALSRGQDARGIGAAVPCLDHPDGRLRRAAANYLAVILEAGRAPDDLIPRIVESLRRLEGEPLALAFRLVLEHGDANAAPAVHALLKRGNTPCLDRAVRSLARWSPELLATLLGGDVTLNQLVFARARERTPVPLGMRAGTIRMLSHPDRRVRRSAAAAAEDFGAAVELVPLIRDADPSVRHAAIGSCARAGVSEATDAIRNRLDDEDPAVRIMAFASLARLRPDLRPELARLSAREECTWAKERMELTLKLTR